MYCPRIARICACARETRGSGSTRCIPAAVERLHFFSDRRSPHLHVEDQLESVRAGIGQFVESVRLVGPDQTTVLRKGEVKFALQDANLHATNVTVFAQVEFKNPGTYYIEVLVDDVMKLRYPVPVILAPPPAQNPQAPAPETPAP